MNRQKHNFDILWCDNENSKNNEPISGLALCDKEKMFFRLVTKNEKKIYEIYRLPLNMLKKYERIYLINARESNNSSRRINKLLKLSKSWDLTKLELVYEIERDDFNNINNYQYQTI